MSAGVEEVGRLEAAVRERFGGTDVLMNNAGIQPGSGVFGPAESWERVLAVNLWGVVHGCQAFVPGMIERRRPGLVINTGSKQGITTPPGDPAYNVSKAGVKTFTEALQHELRNTPDCRIGAHLLIPGFVWTELTARGRSEKPAGAWTPEETVDFMLERLGAGRLLHPVPGQRRAALARRAAHPLGGRRHRREPAAAVALASGLRRGVRVLREERLRESARGGEAVIRRPGCGVDRLRVPWHAIVVQLLERSVRRAAPAGEESECGTQWPH